MPLVSSRHGSNMEDATDGGDNLCPLCMEEMDMTDRQFKPCLCGYQICIWCWHHIMEMAEKDNLEGRCPACRTLYDKEKIVTATISCSRSEFSTEKKQRSNKSKSRAVEGRKNLSNVRVLQRNLVYVVGLTASLADEETLERREFFGQYGKILKLSISKPSSHYSQHSSSGSTVSVYVTYSKEEDASRCIQAVNGYCLEGSTLKACLGTTKYCNAWLKNVTCNNPECLYLHDEGNREDSFTKEEMLAKFGSKAQHFQELIHSAQRYFGVGLPPPLTEVPDAASTSNPAATNGSLLRTSLDFGSSGKNICLPAASSWGSRGASAARSGYVKPSGLSSTRLKAPKLPNSAIPGSSFHTSTASLLPLATTTTSVSVLGCRSNSELIKPTLSSCQLLVGASLKQTNAKNKKTTVGPLQSSSNISQLTSEIPNVNGGVAALSIEERCRMRDSCLPLVCQNGSSNANIGKSYPHDTVFDNHKDHDALIKPTDTVDDWEKNTVDDWEKNDMNTKATGVKIRSISGIGISDSNNFGSFQCDTDTPIDSGGALMPVCSDELSIGSKMSDSSGIVSYTTEACALSVEANTETSHESKGSVHDDLNLDRISIKPNVVSESNESGFEAKNVYLLPSDELLKDAWVQSSPLECFGVSSDNRHQAAVLTTKELQYDGSEEGGGTGETKLCSNMLPMGFNIWSDGSPQDLAELVFGEKNDSLSSPNLSEGPNPWKCQSTKQSRFHFARQQDSLKDFSPTKTDGDGLQLAPTSEFVIGRQTDLENSNRLALQSDGFSDSLRATTSKGKASTYSNATASLKLPLSAPPGFSSSTRASFTPPGFNTGNNMKASGQALEKASFASTTNDYTFQQAVSSSSEIEFMDPAIMAVGRGKVQANLNDSLAWVSEKNFQSSLINNSWNSSPGYALPTKEYSRAFDNDQSSQVQRRVVYRDAGSPSPPFNQKLDVPFSSFLPYVNEHAGSARLLLPSYPDRLNNTVSKIGIQDMAYGAPEFLYQQTGGNIWESWNRVGSISDSSIPRQRMAFNGIGNSNATQPIIDRAFQSLYGDMTANKEIASRSFWDSLSLNGQNDQGQYYNQRIL